MIGASSGNNEFDYEDLVAVFAEDQIAQEQHTHESRRDSFDISAIKPVDAQQLSSSERMAEMEKRGLHYKGFANEDALVLQQYFDEEHRIYIEKLKKERVESKERAAKQAGLQRKRMLMERMLREEQEEVSKDHRIEYWLSLVKQNGTPATAHINVNSVTARSLAKAMWTNSSLTMLDLSRNALDDQAGAFLARMLKRNCSLLKLELQSNEIGPRACSAFAKSLEVNKTLTFLKLENNPLTKGGTDTVGVVDLARMLRVNRTLTSLNLFLTELTPEVGQELSQAMQENDTVVFLDIGDNSIAQVDQKKITDKLTDNQAILGAQKEVAREEREKKDAEDEKEREIQEEVRKAREVREWLEDQRRTRAEERCKKTEDAAAQRKAEEEERKRLEDERLEEERKAREEAEAKKKKKKKGKKKK